MPNPSNFHLMHQTSPIKASIYALLLSVALVGCGKSQEPSSAAMGPGGMALPVSVLEVKATSVPISTETVAQTEGAKEVEIRPRVGGILLKRVYEEGEPVKAGQVMFKIDPVPYQIALAQAKAQLSQQQAKLEQTNREAQRLQSLLASQSISQREYDNASSDAAIAKAALSQAEASVREAELNLSYTDVTAPVSGVSGRFQFSEGALVSANTSLLTTVVQLSPIWVRFSLSDSELAKLGGKLTPKSVKEVSVVLPDGSEYEQKGKLNYSASQIDPNLGTQQLRATFENSDQRLLPGQFVRAKIVTGNRDGVFLVPQTAVLTGEQGKFVFVVDQDKDGKPMAGIRPIQEGSWSGKDWVILGGLKDGDKVIVDNLIKVRPGAPLNPHAMGEQPAMPAPAKK